MEQGDGGEKTRKQEREKQLLWSEVSVYVSQGEERRGAGKKKAFTGKTDRSERGAGRRG